MALSYSSNLPTLPNLYCNEAPNEVVSWEIADHDRDNSVDDCEIVTFAPSSDSDSFFDYDDDSLIHMFDSEVVQTMESHALPDNIVTARQEAVQWILKVNPVRTVFLNFVFTSLYSSSNESFKYCFKKFQVHSFYRFRPETAYLSINYLDRFLTARASPVYVIDLSDYFIFFGLKINYLLLCFGLVF